ncbi:MAG: hypothetical protein ACRDSP_10465 [Pseudonocardiaceae bacterium]
MTMESPARADCTAVAAKTDSGQLCTVTVQRDPLGKHLLRYEGSETVVAALTPEVIELLTVALSLRGRSAVPARCSVGGACTLLVMGHRDGRSSLYFHAAPATCAVLDAAGATKLRAALESLDGRP